MTSVTVEGSLQPCTELARGERRTVALTPRVQRLIDRGYFTLIATHETEVAVAAAQAGVIIDESNSVTIDPRTSIPDAAPSENDADDPPTEPTADSLKADWQAWLDYRGVWYPDGATKVQLIEAWRQVAQQQDAANE